MLPVPKGEIDHVTAVLEALVTVAVNCCFCPAETVAVAWSRVTETSGIRATSAQAPRPDAPVAMIVTVC
jgi:hypothetical protein